MFGPEDIEKERRETTQNAQEAEGSNDPKEQHCLGVHAEICSRKKNHIFRTQETHGVENLPG